MVDIGFIQVVKLAMAIAEKCRVCYAVFVCKLEGRRIIKESVLPLISGM